MATPTQIPAIFKLVLICVLGITLLSFLGLGCIAIWGNPATTENAIPISQRNFQAACNFGWQAGPGGILGLIGGKTTK
ncbi:MAG: hypothetical protein LV480_06845 [Methylacidiphilales bacterium]|nr:hypothetical protein [Candidatus Methylacidiphilales bacterium]